MAMAGPTPISPLLILDTPADKAIMAKKMPKKISPIPAHANPLTKNAHKFLRQPLKLIFIASNGGTSCRTTRAGEKTIVIWTGMINSSMIKNSNITIKKSSAETLPPTAAWKSLPKLKPTKAASRMPAMSIMNRIAVK